MQIDELLKGFVMFTGMFLQEKEVSIPEELGKDAQSVAALQRRHANFEHDLLTLGAQVTTSSP